MTTVITPKWWLISCKRIWTDINTVCLIKLKWSYMGRDQQRTTVSYLSWVPLLHFLQSMDNQYVLYVSENTLLSFCCFSLFSSLYTLGLCYLQWVLEWHKALFKPYLCLAFHWVFSDTTLYHTMQEKPF